MTNPGCSGEASKVGNFDCAYDCRLRDNTVNQPFIASISMLQLEVVLLDDDFDLRRYLARSDSRTVHGCTGQITSSACGNRFLESASTWCKSMIET
jgi:hypothetical protein